MPRKSRDEYDLRPNMNDKPNSQGTLFRAPVSARKPEARQPRGYSPQRMAEVREATDSNIKPLQKLPGERRPKWEGKRAKFRLQETLARSAIDIETIKGVNTWSVNNDELEDDAAAEHRGYPARPGTDDKPHSTIAITPETEKDSFIVSHEVGHSYRFNHDLRPDTRYPYEHGQEEGAADQYGKEMSRKPGYKSRSDYSPSAYERFAQNNRYNDFSQGYLSSRVMDDHDDWSGSTHQQKALFSEHEPDYDWRRMRD